MIDVTRLELGWCAACNTICEATEITFTKPFSSRRVILCDNCINELAEKITPEPIESVPMLEVPAWMTGGH